MKTPETPGMRRWTGGTHRYFIRWAQKLTGGSYITSDGKVYNVPDTERFVLGEEVLINTETNEHTQISQIEFRTTDAQTLLDNVAALNGMPTYTAQLQRWALLEDLLDSVEKKQYDGKYRDESAQGIVTGQVLLARKIREIFKETK